MNKVKRSNSMDRSVLTEEVIIVIIYVPTLNKTIISKNVVTIVLFKQNIERQECHFSLCIAILTSCSLSFNLYRVKQNLTRYIFSGDF